MTEPYATWRALFASRGFAVLPGLITGPHLASLRRYHRQLLAAGSLRFGDGQCHLRWVAHNERAARTLQRQLAPLMAEVAGVSIKPSYVYTACYESGAELLRHTDRAQCEYSISMSVDFQPEPAGPTPWPLCLETPTGTVAIRQSLGDALFYRGRHLPHFRSRLPPGYRSTSVFLHYVDSYFGGPLD